MEQLSYEDLKKAYDDLSNMYSILQEKYHDVLANGDALGELRSLIIKELLKVNTLLTQQYERVVEQNKSLQQELRKIDSGDKH